MNWRKTGIFSLTVVGFLAAAGILYAASGGGGHHVDSLSPEKLWDLLYRVLNFTGLVIILVYFLRKPVSNALGSRRQAIKEQFEELEAQKADAERKYREYESKLASIDAEVKSIVEAAVQQGEAEKQRIIEDANRAAGDIKRQAEMAVQHELAEAKRRLREDLADQAVAVAEELISKSLQEADQVKLVEDYLEKVGALQ